MSNIPENVLVDDADRQMLEAMGKWRINSKGYCCKSDCLMHRIIINAPNNMEVDHINRNRLDNRKCNLRLVTRQQNEWNKLSKGYYWDRDRNKWRSKIYVNKKRIYLGDFNTEEEARAAYLAAKEKYHKI